MRADGVHARGEAHLVLVAQPTKEEDCSHHQKQECGQTQTQAQTQTQMAQTLAELAEQNARLVAAVELLRVRTRVLMFVIAALVIGVIVLFAR